MGSPKNLKKEFPSVVNSAYKQYLHDRSRYKEVKDLMSQDVVTIAPEASMAEAAGIMGEKHIGSLIVTKYEAPVGIVTERDLLRSLPEVPETEVKVDDFMTKRVETADEKTPVASIAKMMGQRRIGSVIITRKGDPFGIFTERDLLTTFLVKGKPLIGEVGKEASSPLITAPVGTSVHQAAVTMAIAHIRRLPITRNGKLVGIITARDLVEADAK